MGSVATIDLGGRRCEGGNVRDEVAGKEQRVRHGGGRLRGGGHLWFKAVGGEG